MKIEPAIPKNEYSSVSFNPLKNIGRLALTTSKLISNNSLMKIFQTPWKILKSINKKIKVLCGAGISTGDDMKAAMDLGADGVLLASGIVKAENPKEALLDLVSKL